MSKLLAGLVTASAIALVAPQARAFCGFYVGGADAKLFNNATQVVMMREGTRTVLSMQNNYQGPPSDFAMVVPVPVVLRKENVKTLPRDVFDHIDQLTAPRLVEYWEQDPCAPPHPPMDTMVMKSAPVMVTSESAESESKHRVKIEARFSVGEYDILVLSAKDSTGLDAWLHENNYKIPNGAEPLLRPYVQTGMKFFVAKVNVKKVAFQNGQAMLSPLRFHYDTDQFFLPIRLGLVNSGGTQNLIVNILARNQRYEVSNYNNVSIPTNLNLTEEASGKFGAMYAALFDKVVERTPHTVVTEYAWSSGSCDPCPGPTLDPQEIMSLGADAMPDADSEEGFNPSDFVVTRLHTRYSANALGDDLFFKKAHPIVGGREITGENGQLEQGARPDSTNNFQARYAIRHPWKGPIACEHPKRGQWGPRPDGETPRVAAAQNLAFAPRGGVTLSALIKDPLPDGIVLSEGEPTPPVRIPKSGGCAGCATTSSAAGTLGAVGAIAALGVALARRRRR